MILLRKATKNDSEFLFTLRNEESVRRVSGNPESISRETHEKWFEEKLTSSAAVIFIAEENGSAIAYVRFEVIQKDTASISVALVPSARGKGNGTRIITQATTRFLDEHPALSEVRAYINLGNEASEKSFSAAGYEPKGDSERGGMRQHLLISKKKR